MYVQCLWGTEEGESTSKMELQMVVPCYMAAGDWSFLQAHALNSIAISPTPFCPFDFYYLLFVGACVEIFLERVLFLLCEFWEQAQVPLPWRFLLSGFYRPL